MTRKKFYIGYKHDGDVEVFGEKETPTQRTHGKLYYGIFGPMPTKREALYYVKTMISSRILTLGEML